MQGMQAVPRFHLTVFEEATENWAVLTHIELLHLLHEMVLQMARRQHGMQHHIQDGVQKSHSCEAVSVQAGHEPLAYDKMPEEAPHGLRKLIGTCRQAL